MLALLPENHECFEPLRALMEKISARMLEIRVDGAWLQVLDCPGREGNYLESSGSCLMTAAILKAAANHQLPDWMLAAAQESFRAIQRHFVGQMPGWHAVSGENVLRRGAGRKNGRVPRRVV